MSLKDKIRELANFHAGIRNYWIPYYQDNASETARMLMRKSLKVASYALMMLLGYIANWLQVTAANMPQHINLATEDRLRVELVQSDTVRTGLSNPEHNRIFQEAIELNRLDILEAQVSDIQNGQDQEADVAGRGGDSRLVRRTQGQ